MENLFNHLEQVVLRMDSRFCTEDGHLLKNNVVEAALALEPKLLHYLLADEKLKKQFFSEVDGLLVFDKVKCQRFVMNKQFLPDSYTAFKNKVGLTNENGEFLSESREVVLSWPYKDCMLEGGQTKEDAKRQEIFWNETLAPDEINRLTEPKALCHFRRYDSKGEHEATELRPDDNLIIKGNNLLALYSLRERFRNSVKLIYIDPPYNTGNDSFGYNDSFNMSTWLTFMKNRLEIAKELLTNDGSIYLQLDFNCVHYAKVLMDSVFGKDNFQREIIWRIGWVSGYKTADNNWIRNHDTILFYSRNNNAMEFIKHYIPRSEFKNIAQGNSDRYPIEDVWNGNEYDDLNSIAIVSFAGETVSKLLNEDDEVKGQKSEKLIKRIIDAHIKEGDIVLDFFGGTGTTGAVAHKMGVQYILCEQLDKHIDIIKRRLQKVIKGDPTGISKSVGWNPQNPGLLDGDKYAHNSFVYCELAQANQQLVEEIMAATEPFKLQEMWQQLQEKGFLSYKVSPKMFNEHAEDFNDLSLDDQKRFLIECLDKNMLYIPFADIDDEAFTLTKNDKLLTRQFYARR